MSAALLGASWRAVGRRTPVLAPALAGVVLLASATPLLDGGYAGTVLHGLILLGGAVLIGATDDPSAEICATSPYSCRTRTALRLSIGASLAVPLLGAGLLVVHLRRPGLPLGPFVVEAVGVCLVAVALGVGVRAWLDLAHPAYLATVGLIGVALAAFVLPRAWMLLDPQPWGPPWAGARWRWLGVAVLAVGLALAATADPADRVRGPRRTRRPAANLSGERAPGPPPPERDAIDE